MTRFALAVLFFGALAAVTTPPGAAQEKEKKGVDPNAALAKKVTIAVERVSGSEFLAKAATASGATFVINRTAFQRAGVKDFDDTTVAKVDVKDVPLSRVLTDTLNAAGATFKAGKDHIEILPLRK